MGAARSGRKRNLSELGSRPWCVEVQGAPRDLERRFKPSHPDLAAQVLLLDTNRLAVGGDGAGINASILLDASPSRLGGRTRFGMNSGMLAAWSRSISRCPLRQASSPATRVSCWPLFAALSSLLMSSSWRRECSDRSSWRTSYGRPVGSLRAHQRWSASSSPREERLQPGEVRVCQRPLAAKQLRAALRADRSHPQQ